MQFEFRVPKSVADHIQKQEAHVPHRSPEQHSTLTKNTLNN